jgi:hypothetical protein
MENPRAHTAPEEQPLCEKKEIEGNFAQTVCPNQAVTSGVRSGIPYGPHISAGLRKTKTDDRAVARCLRSNGRAIRVLQKCAFRPANLPGKDIRLFTLVKSTLAIG